MKIVKYNKASAIQSSSSGGSYGGNTENTTIGKDLDRTIWGQNDTGDDIDGSMVVNGNISIKVINYNWEDEEDDGDGEYEDYEEGGGNLDVELKITSNEVEAKDIYATRHLFINYPSHPEHTEDSKKCIGEILKNVEDSVKDNKNEIDALKVRVSNNETQIEVNEKNIEINEIAIKNNNDEILKLKSRLDNTESSVNDMMPVGSIIMFNGEADKIPDNWHICDGTAGTPNLIDKFIKASDKAGTTGGSDSITLATNNIPKLLARIDTDNLSNLDRYDKYMPLLDEVEEYVFDKGGSTHYCLYTGYNAGDRGLISQKYRYMMADVANNTVVGYDNPTAIDIQPSYYSLIYIMKIK